MSINKLQVFKKYLDGNLSKKFIWTLLSLATAPVLFVKKPEDNLQFSVNYRGLHVLIIKNKSLLLLIRDTLNLLCNTIYFIRLDIIAAFNKICMAAGEE